MKKKINKFFSKKKNGNKVLCRHLFALVIFMNGTARGLLFLCVACNRCVQYHVLKIKRTTIIMPVYIVGNVARNFRFEIQLTVCFENDLLEKLFVVQIFGCNSQRECISINFQALTEMAFIQLIYSD